MESDAIHDAGVSFFQVAFSSHLEAVFSFNFGANVRLPLSVAFDAILGVVVAFWALRWWENWHCFFVVSRCVCFRLQMLSSGLSWLFAARFGTHFGRCFKLFSSTF